MKCSIMPVLQGCMILTHLKIMKKHYAIVNLQMPRLNNINICNAGLIRAL